MTHAQLFWQILPQQSLPEHKAQSIPLQVNANTARGPNPITKVGGLSVASVSRHPLKYLLLINRREKEPKNICTWACALQEARQQEAEIRPSPHHFHSKRDNYTRGDPTQHRGSLKPRFYEPVHQAPPLSGEDDSRFWMEYKDTPFGDKSTTTESRATPERSRSSSTQCGYLPSVTGHLLKMSSTVVTSRQPWNKQVQTLTTHHTVRRSRLHPWRTPLSPRGQTTSLPTTTSHDDLNTLRPTLLEKLQAFHWENYCNPWLADWQRNYQSQVRPEMLLRIQRICNGVQSTPLDSHWETNLLHFTLTVNLQLFIQKSVVWNLNLC